MLRRIPSVGLAWVLLGAAFVSAVVPVSAQDAREETHAPADEGTPEREPPRAALEHYKKGRELYLAGRYREAAVELEAAVALDPDSANLLYNLARVYELLGEIDTAIRHYKRYRSILPAREVEERARVTGTLQRLEGAREQVPDPSPAASLPPPVERKRGVADGTFWSFTTVAAVSLITGGALGIAALNSEKDAKRLVLDGDDSVARRKDLLTRTDRLALGCDLSLLAGAVLGTTAILLYALREKPVQNSPRAVFDVGAGPSGAFLLLRGQL